MIKINDNLYRIDFYNLLNFPENYVDSVKDNNFEGYDWWFNDGPYIQNYNKFHTLGH